MLKTAIVILNWNGRRLLDKFLPTVILHSDEPDVKIFIADNGSTDGSVEFVRHKFPSIKIIRLDKNYGFAEGYNRALSQIEAEFFVLLNSDIEVTPGWINPVISYLENNDKLAACMPKILSFKDRNYFEHAGAAGGFIDKYGYPFCRGRIFYHIEKDEGQYDSTTEVFWATGACLFIKAALFKKAGGFDADFFAHMEEIDLCWRLKNIGYKIGYFKDVTVYHVGGGTLSTLHPIKTYYNFRNNLFLLYKNLPSAGFCTIMLKRFLLDGIAGARFLLRLELRNFMAIFKAHLSFYFLFFKFRKKRKLLQKQYINFNHPEMLNKSIVAEFYLRNKCKFSEIEF